MLKKQLTYLFFLCCSFSYSQIGGKSVYQFLNLVTSPRQAALGGKTVTIYDEDVNQGIFNPASINAEMDNHLSINYGSYFGEVTYGTAAYAYTYDRHVQTFHAGVSYINYGNFDGYDENGQSTAAFSGSEIALSGGYAYNIPYTNIHLGANVKLISSSLETYTSLGGAIDFGALFIDEANDVNWGLAIRNVGTQFTTYSGLREKSPMEIILGVSQELEHVPIRWHINLENLQQWNISFANPSRATSSFDGTTTDEKVSFLGNTFRHVILGAELFPKKAFNFRMSYNFRRAQELKILEQRNFSGFSVGFGLRMNKLKFDYSYSRYTLAGNTSLFGLTINFQ
ncbi:penicillin-binding protein [Flavobacterium faecale]|uniref:Penicillin-binding protein n=1 Tax=Flavobacterium faecale TaxID=1355330 RepID=A0A2S1LFI9_9FLAO|nr:type IX secretion system protein PorQ [Flavobacterium faecale]AWG22552.1 penicillin-binding protein [Flavobacterium faecale]